MISNYSHDHIALDTMNIMANGQYIDQIMTNNQFYIFILTPKVSRQGKIRFEKSFLCLLAVVLLGQHEVRK